MKKTKMTNYALTVVCIVVTMLLTDMARAEEQEITIGSGGVTGVYYPVAVSICRLFNAEYSFQGYGCSVEKTNGSIDNLKKLRAGEVNFAIVQSDWQAHAYKGTNVFAKVGRHERLRSILALYSESFTVLARSDSKIARFEDLRGRRVNIGNSGSGQRATMEVVMRAFGWSRFDFSTVREFNSDHQAQALCDDEIDVIVFVAGHPSGTIKSATEKCDANLIEVRGANIDALIQENNYYRKTKIPAGVYRGQSEDIATFGINATMVTTSEVPSALTKLLLQSVFGNLHRLRKMHPALANLKAEEMKEDIMPAPLHEGAVEFYRETSTD